MADGKHGWMSAAGDCCYAHSSPPKAFSRSWRGTRLLPNIWLQTGSNADTGISPASRGAELRSTRDEMT